MLILCTMCVMSVSCKSIEHVESSSEVQKFRSVDTIYQHDSIFIREIIRGDTVYLTRTEWRDRWRTQLVHDTVHHTEFMEKIIEKPPERYIPAFHKWCTGLFWTIVAIFILYIAFRIVIRIYARK